MDSTNDISLGILKCVKETSDQISSEYKKGEDSDRIAQLFLELFENNLRTAVNTVYFNGSDHEKIKDGLKKEKEELSYEKAVMDIICKRKQGTSVCKDVLEKTLAIEKKTLMAIEVSKENSETSIPNVPKLEKYSRPCTKDELKFRTKKSAEYIKSTMRGVMDLKNYAEDLITGLIIYNDINDFDFECTEY